MDNNHVKIKENSCRICLQKDGLLFSIFKKRSSGFSPYDKLVCYTRLKIQVTDSGPACICSCCLTKLDITVQFLDECEESNKLLGSLENCVQNFDTILRHDSQLCPEKLYKEPITDSKIYTCDGMSGEAIENVIENEEYHSNSGDSQNEKVNVKDTLLTPDLCQCPECGSKRQCKHWRPPMEYTCQHCHRVFNKKFNYLLHIKRHTGEKEHSCPKCGTRQLTSWLARRHCAPRPRRACPLADCGKTFTSVTNLQTHIRMHNGERPHQCSVCGKHFACKNTLNDHVRIHTGEKPYVCSVCGARFTTNKLSAHMRTHTGVRPHQCPLAGCGRACPSPRALALHARTHAPRARTHACPLCAAAYCHSQSLKKHLRNQHGQKAKPATKCKLAEKVQII